MRTFMRASRRTHLQSVSVAGALMGSVDKFLMMTVSLALLVGVVGIINTMLMSTSERFIEFGVLRTNGWSKGNILALVTLESGYLGLFSGIIGCVLATSRAAQSPIGPSAIMANAPTVSGMVSAMRS